MYENLLHGGAILYVVIFCAASSTRMAGVAEWIIAQTLQFSIVDAVHIMMTRAEYSQPAYKTRIHRYTVLYEARSAQLCHILTHLCAHVLCHCVCVSMSAFLNSLWHSLWRFLLHMRILFASLDSGFELMGHQRISLVQGIEKKKHHKYICIQFINSLCVCVCVCMMWHFCIAKLFGYTIGSNLGPFLHSPNFAQLPNRNGAQYYNCGDSSTF